MRATSYNRCWYSPFTGGPHQWVWVSYLFTRIGYLPWSLELQLVVFSNSTTSSATCDWFSLSIGFPSLYRPLIWENRPLVNNKWTSWVWAITSWSSQGWRKLIDHFWIIYKIFLKLVKKAPKGVNMWPESIQTLVLAPPHATTITQGEKSFCYNIACIFWIFPPTSPNICNKNL
jgi:hypothetical protein